MSHERTPDHEPAELAPGVWRFALRTPTLPPATATNTMVVGDEALLVIEPATPHADERARLEAHLHGLAEQGRRVAAIAITHHHFDHVGAVQWMRERFAAPVLAHPETAARVPFDVDGTLEDGDVVPGLGARRVEAHFTPGHAPGHLVFFDVASGIAHAGDLVAGEGTILIDPEDAGDMAQYLDSLRRLAALGARALVPAHGPVQYEPEALVEHYVAHRLMREAKVLAAIGSTPRPQDEVLANAYDDAPKQVLPLAARSLEAHLRKLEAEGRIERGADGVALRSRD